MLCIRIPCWELPRNYRITWDKFELSGKINLIVESIPRISPWIVWLGGKNEKKLPILFFKNWSKDEFFKWWWQDYGRNCRSVAADLIRNAADTQHMHWQHKTQVRSTLYFNARNYFDIRLRAEFCAITC